MLLITFAGEGSDVSGCKLRRNHISKKIRIPTVDGIICGFCLPYLSYDDSYKFFTDCYNVLNDDGLLYISFVEGDPNKSDFQVGSTGDRVYFYFYNLNELCAQLTENQFGDFRILKVPYTRKEKNTEIHTIIIAKKNVTC